MKLIFTRSLSELVAVAALCPSMDLLAVATRKGFLSVYALSQQQPIFSVNLLDSNNSSSKEGSAPNSPPNSPASSLPTSSGGGGIEVACASWTASGRLLAVGFSSPLVCIVCVEKGDVLRRFAAQERFEPSDHVLAARSTGCWPISLRTDEGIMLAAWFDSPVSQKMADVGTQECLQLPPARKTIAAILEDSWRQGMSAVLILLGDRGTVSVLLGGVREVWFRVVDLPDVLRMGVQSHRQPPQARPAAAIIGEVAVSEGIGDVYFTVRCDPKRQEDHNIAAQRCSGPPQQQHAELVVVLPMSRVMPSLAHPVAVANCLVKEYEGIALTSFTKAASGWATAVAAVTQTLKLHQSASLLRDALIDALASPDQSVVHEYLVQLQPGKVIAVAEALRVAARSSIAVVIGTSYVAFDQAIELSARITGMAGYSSRIRGLKHSCSTFLSLVAKECQHYELLLRWVLVILSAKTGAALSDPAAAVAAQSFVFQPPPSHQHTHILSLLQALCVLYEPEQHEEFTYRDSTLSAAAGNAPPASLAAYSPLRREGMCGAAAANYFVNFAGDYAEFVNRAAASHWSEEDASSLFALRGSTSGPCRNTDNNPGALQLAVADWSHAIRSPSIAVRSVTFFVSPPAAGGKALHAAIVAAASSSGDAAAGENGAAVVVLLASFALTGSGSGIELVSGPSPLCSELTRFCSGGVVASGFLDDSQLLLSVRLAKGVADGVTIVRALCDGTPYVPSSQPESDNEEDDDNDGAVVDEAAELPRNPEKPSEGAASVLHIEGLRTGGESPWVPSLGVCAPRGFAVVTCGPQVAVIDFAE